MLRRRVLWVEKVHKTFALSDPTSGHEASHKSSIFCAYYTFCLSHVGLAPTLCALLTKLSSNHFGIDAWRPPVLAVGRLAMFVNVGDT